jgi:single-stranded DNA-binding protein
MTTVTLAPDARAGVPSTSFDRRRTGSSAGRTVQQVEDRLAVMQNQVYLIGRLCHSPNLCRARSGRCKVAFRLAVPRSLARTHWRSAHHGNDPRVDYATVILLGHPARELHAQRLPRGAWVSVQGRLQTWSNGQWEVVAHNVALAPMGAV